MVRTLAGALLTLAVIVLVTILVWWSGDADDDAAEAAPVPVDVQSEAATPAQASDVAGPVPPTSGQPVAAEDDAHVPAADPLTGIPRDTDVLDRADPLAVAQNAFALEAGKAGDTARFSASLAPEPFDAAAYARDPQPYLTEVDARRQWQTASDASGAPAMDLLSESETPLPLEVSKDVDADLSTRLDTRYMDVRNPEVRAIFSLRSKAMAAMRDWFESEQFEEVDTPLLSEAGAEGGADLFPVVYYDKEAFLSQSPQLYKQMLVAAGFDRLYEVGHAFRAEDFSTSRHVSEIAMFDVELGYITDHNDVMDVQEESLRHTIRAVVENAERELELLDSELTVPEEPFPRITFDEALDILEEEYGHFPDDPTDLDTKGEKLLGEYFEEQGHPAIFVVGYPEEKFYYWQREGDDIASRKFDLLYRGQELSSGGQREHDRETLIAAMEAGGVDPADFEFYLDAFRYGVPPHGGYGLGIDRMIQQMEQAGLPPPDFRETAAGFLVTLQGHTFASSVAEGVDTQEWEKMGLNERQIAALLHLAEHRRITNRDLQEIAPEVSAETLRRDLADLVERGLLLKVGEKRATYYILK